MNYRDLTIKNPFLLTDAAKVLAAMNNECSATHGRIFEVLAIIFAEQSNEHQMAATFILKNIMRILFYQFEPKSLNKRNKLRINLRRETKEYLIRECAAQGLSNTMTTHMLCAFGAVWRNIERRMLMENKKVDFYESGFKKNSTYFI